LTQSVQLTLSTLLALFAVDVVEFAVDIV